MTPTLQLDARHPTQKTAGNQAERLVVVVLEPEGPPAIFCDGPSEAVWDAVGKPQKNGQRAIGLSRLARLI